MKKFIIGFILGSLIFSFAGVYAANTIKSAIFNNDIKYNIYGNEFTTETLSVTLDGQTSGKNYVSVRALAEKMGAVVEYDEILKTIFISSPNQTKRSPDGIQAGYNDGKYYISLTRFKEKYTDKGFTFSKNYQNNPISYCIKKDNKIILDNIQLFSGAAFEYDYYVNTILPFLK